MTSDLRKERMTAQEVDDSNPVLDELNAELRDNGAPCGKIGLNTGDPKTSGV